MNSERYDNDTIHDTASNTSRLTAKTAGLYAIGGNVVFATNTTGRRLARLLVNGATVIGQVEIPPTSGGEASIQVTADYQLAVNDWVELQAFQSSGGALNVTVSANISPEAWMHWVSN